MVTGNVNVANQINVMQGAGRRKRRRRRRGGREEEEKGEEKGKRKEDSFPRWQERKNMAGQVYFIVYTCCGINRTFLMILKHIFLYNYNFILYI